jgi:hypothetical protein
VRIHSSSRTDGIGNSWNRCHAARRKSVSHAGSSRVERKFSNADSVKPPRSVGTKVLVMLKVTSYPTDPSICSSISRFISTAYSMGSSFTRGSMKPLTIIELASASVRPRLCR